MANGSEQAIDNATRLSEIGFPEFTAKLITDTFNAITASYIDQMAQYMNVVQVVGQTLQDYINNTRDDIGPDEINSFLVAIGGLNDDALNFLLGDPTAAAPHLSTTEAAAINAATALPAAAGPAAPSAAPASNGALNANRRTTIAQAIARRIAANKYDLLQTMVRQGILRLYVDNGTIETRLTFSTYGQAISSSSQSNRDRIEASGGAGGGAGFGLGGLAGAAGAVLTGFGFGGGFSESRLTVSTSKESQRDVSGSRVQIFGRVKLNFKTDLLPLAAPPP
jgi:hypothetical protein